MAGIEDEIGEVSQELLRYLTARGRGRGRPQTPSPSIRPGPVPARPASMPGPSSRQTTLTVATPSRRTSLPLPATSTVASPSTLPTVSQDMQRSFNYMRRDAVRSKKRPAALSKIAPAISKKFMRLQFFAMPGPAGRTPNSAEEITLLEAGLGKRTVTMAEDDGHAEIVSLLESHYTKLQQLNGAWLFFKASGDVAIGEGVRRHFISFAMHVVQTGIHMNFGTANITTLFEGEKNHLIPCGSQPLVDNDLFVMAGRVAGHSFIHGGPGLAGISLAVVHVLLGGALETAMLEMEDCPDLEQRETIQLLEDNEELSEDHLADVRQLTERFELPPLTGSNRMYIHQKLLQQMVLGRTTPQIRQLRKGLKETGLWPILSVRRDVADLVFPRDVACSPQVMIDHILWPTVGDDEDDEDYSIETRARIAGYLRQFIETAPAETLVELLKFWSGWEVLSEELILEVKCGQFPTSKTCYKTLRIPGHFKEYQAFKNALEASIDTVDSGFGMH